MFEAIYNVIGTSGVDESQASFTDQTLNINFRVKYLKLVNNAKNSDQLFTHNLQMEYNLVFNLKFSQKRQIFEINFKIENFGIKNRI
ncbi:hypothetical protein BpHYR1_048887 [Brachionus plicatilis]|uniref:Uncharacterized protein n=1 Tax=Brachionus plicatilis TaxID=10195 RepID=A0A3M7QJN9_BRAPC|nr:hypothetical protein BpHYR1_048887 [Brachionus plicatilis]